ncbi:hypothetical protein Leryth_017833 [Lithospermum erythrorhizon]|nr:hypothetical protein Leryth_017833 [Lithospermum erythrorhizon]
MEGEYTKICETRLINQGATFGPVCLEPTRVPPFNWRTNELIANLDVSDRAKPGTSEGFLGRIRRKGLILAGVEVNRRDEDGYFNKEDISEAVGIVMLEGDKDYSKSIKENHKKWKDFLMDKNTHNKFIQDLVKDMKAMM